MSAHQFPGRFLNPRVFSAYYTPLPKSRRFLTLINVFLRLRRKRHGTGKNDKFVRFSDNFAETPPSSQYKILYQIL